jgi:integrase
MPLKPAGGKYEGVWYNELKSGHTSYYINYRDENGKPTIKKVGVNTPQSRFTVKDAYDALIAVKHALNTGQEAPIKNARRAKFTMQDAFESYIELAKGNKKTWQEDEYRYNKHIKEVLGKYELIKLDMKIFESLKTQKTQEGFKEQTVKHILGICRQIINHCIKYEYVKNYSNPLSDGKVKMPQIDNARQAFLTHEEARELLGYLNTDLTRTAYLYTLFCLWTGARLSEVANLKWQDVNFETNKIYFPKTKGGNSRYVPISKILRSEFLKLADLKKGQYVLFGDKESDKKGRMPESFETAMEMVRPGNSKLTDQYKITAHSLRHTHASWLAMAGLDIMHIKEQLGHKTIQMTLRYSHLIPNRRDKVIEEIEREF